MSYCPHCGSKVNDNSTFCGNCGNQMKKIGKETKGFTLPMSFESIPNFDVKNIFSKIKGFFSHFYVDYNSKFFKFAMIMFLAIGIGEPLYTLIIGLLKFDVYSLFAGASTVFNFAMCAILFLAFTIPILKMKSKKTIKKSNFVRIFWIVSVVLNFLVFLAEINLYEYIIYSNYASSIINILMVVSSAILIFKTKPKYPFISMVSALSLALANSSKWSIDLNIDLYKISPSTGDFLAILETSRYIVLVAVAFLLIYLIPRKISKWIVVALAGAVLIYRAVRLFEPFEFIDILTIIRETALVVAIVLFALSCSRKINYDYVVTSSAKTKKDIIKVGVISSISLAVIIISYLLVSAIICSIHINNGLAKWENKLVNGTINPSTEWSEMNKDIFKYTSTRFVSQFVDEYDLYETLKENRSSMEKIAVCYSAYITDKVDDEIIKKYSYINVDNSWANDTTLSAYYKKYLEMKPNIDKVSVSATVNVDKGQIEVTVTNKNKMPISKCTVECKFTILFIEPGYYSSNEYGRGSETIIVENIAGSSNEKKVISFNPDDYYDSYGSYIMAALFESSAKVTSIE